MRIILGIIIVGVGLIAIGYQVHWLKEHARVRAKAIDCLVEHTPYDRSTLEKMNDSELEELLDKVLEQRKLKEQTKDEDKDDSKEDRKGQMNDILKFYGDGFAEIVDNQGLDMGHSDFGMGYPWGIPLFEKMKSIWDHCPSSNMLRRDLLDLAKGRRVK